MKYLVDIEENGDVEIEADLPDKAVVAECERLERMGLHTDDNSSAVVTMPDGTQQTFKVWVEIERLYHATEMIP